MLVDMWFVSLRMVTEPTRPGSTGRCAWSTKDELDGAAVLEGAISLVRWSMCSWSQRRGVALVRRRGGRTSATNSRGRVARPASIGFVSAIAVPGGRGRDRTRATPRSSVTSGCPSSVKPGGGQSAGPSTISRVGGRRGAADAAGPSMPCTSRRGTAPAAVRTPADESGSCHRHPGSRPAGPVPSRSRPRPRCGVAASHRARPPPRWR